MTRLIAEHEFLLSSGTHVVVAAAAADELALSATHVDKRPRAVHDRTPVGDRLRIAAVAAWCIAAAKRRAGVGQELGALGQPGLSMYLGSQIS